jgi:NitT/TauT family transport system substrate-binding protein
MPFKKTVEFGANLLSNGVSRIPFGWRIIIGALGWLILISGLHYQFNVDHGKRNTVHIGYMPVITNLACPLLDDVTRSGNGIRFHSTKFASFAELAEALRNDQIQAAFIIAPLAIVLRNQGEDVKIVAVGNRHESTLVVRKALNAKCFSDLAGKTLAVPMRYSGHYISIMQMIERHGLDGQIKVVEMNPPDMASALASGSLDAYFVGEPFAAQTVKNGDANVLFYVEDIWKNFICNLVLVKREFIENNPDQVRMLVQGTARAGIWAKNNVKAAARIAADYWNQPVDLVEYALMMPKDRIVYDHFVPKKDEMQYIADLMVRFGLIKNSDITGLIEDEFVRQVDLSGISDLKSILCL